MTKYKPIKISGREVYPIIEGGKGISVSTGITSGRWAASGGVGTFSGVNADSYDKDGNVIPQIYKSKSRKGRQKEMIDYAIDGGIAQAQIAHEEAQGQGAIHMNVLWEMGASSTVLDGILSGTKGLIHGITCGAGMPFKLSEIAAKFGVYYYPIVSSSRAFKALWNRSYKKTADLLGGVVYEDPWLAGGHNGLSNSESFDSAQRPYERVIELRSIMNSLGLNDTPIIMAGGVWCLEEWEDWINNPEIAPIAFQLGTRPMVTQESPIPDDWKQLFFKLKKDDVLLQRFSPTGFYSSAIKNEFMNELIARSDRQTPYSKEQNEEFSEQYKNKYFVKPESLIAINKWQEEGFSVAMPTPENTLVFVSDSKAKEIKQDMAFCVGCLSQCAFSSWSQNEKGTTGRAPDPRSFCIQKTLQNISHGGSIHEELLFSGHNAYRFAQDPFYRKGKFIPTISELVERILTGK